MSGDPRRRSCELPRRTFLEVLAAAPCALAACSTSGPRSAVAASGRAAAESARGAASEDADVASVRALGLPREAEPALVFRAAAARPGAR